MTSTKGVPYRTPGISEATILDMISKCTIRYCTEHNLSEDLLNDCLTYLRKVGYERLPYTNLLECADLQLNNQKTYLRVGDNVKIAPLDYMSDTVREISESRESVFVIKIEFRPGAKYEYSIDLVTKEGQILKGFAPEDIIKEDRIEINR